MKKKLILLLLLVCLCTGCTKYISDKDNKRVINEQTGQSLPSNILCKPKEKNLLSIYEKYEDNLLVELKDLPNCEKFKIGAGKYTSLWESILVKPLAYIIIKLGVLVKNYGLSVMIIGFLIRALMYPLSKKSLSQSENMKKAQPELDRIEKKYKDKTDKESTLLKSQEVMSTYKQYGINPTSGCLFTFFQLPIFFAFLEAINRVPAIFEGKFLTLQLGTTPWIGITSGNYLYIILIVLIIVTTYFSFKNSMATAGNSEQQKQMKFMTIFMIVFISFASFSLPTAIALYWIVTNAFTVVQNILLKRKK